MARPKKDVARIRMQITLAPESHRILHEISNATYIPMSNILDMMIAEYSKTHKEDLVRKGVSVDG